MKIYSKEMAEYEGKKKTESVSYTYLEHHGLTMTGLTTLL